LKRVASIFIGLCLLVLIGYAVWDFMNKKSMESRTYYPEVSSEVVEKTFKNHARMALMAEKREAVPAEYLLAVTALESSGRKIIPRRFEKHVYKKLIKLSSSKIKSYNALKPDDLKGMNVSDIKNAASSWGPCQIMGYHSLHMGIEFKDLEGSDALIYAAKWMKMNYPHRLDKKDWKNAFHMHNTGKPYPIWGGPRTYNKKYVSNGMVYMKAFEEKLAQLK
jgi:hypothetical protein